MNMTHFKPKSTQNSFIKQYQDFLHKTRKTHELKKISTSHSPLIRTNNNHNNNNNNTNSFKLNTKLQTSPSPKRFNEVQNKRTYSALFTTETTSTSTSTKTDDNQQQQQQQQLQQGIVGILSLIKQEKQIIMNDMKEMTKSMDKYKIQYDELQNEQEHLQHQLRVARDGEEIHGRTKDKINDTYIQMISLLKGLQVQFQDVLPQLDYNNNNNNNNNSNNDETNEEQIRNPDKDEIIILQKLIIKKLVKKIEDQKQLNQLLSTKIKEYQI